MTRTKKNIQSAIKLLSGLMIATAFLATGCGTKQVASNTPHPASNTANTTENKTSTTATTTASDASAVVKQIYDHAIKRECAAIPPLLVEEFKKEVGTSKDGLDALCDSLTDSGKITSVEIKGEDVKGDSAIVKVSQVYKDGKKEEKEEKMKKAPDGKWLMDS